MSLTEALTHLQFTRKGFEMNEGNLEGFKKPLEKFAKKAKKPAAVAGPEETSKSASSKSTKAKPKTKTKTKKKTAPKSNKGKSTKSTKQ